MKLSNTLLVGAVIATATLSGGCFIVADDDPGDSTLTVANRSSYWLDELYIAHVNDASWGPDLIAGSLPPGSDVIIYDIVCGRYDVLVVDETGVECELANLDLCFDDDLWVVDDVTLDICAFGL